MTEGHPESVNVMRVQEFVVDPEAVIDGANASGEPVVLTGHGRFMFLIEPLDTQEPDQNVDTESR